MIRIIETIITTKNYNDENDDCNQRENNNDKNDNSTTK